MPRDPLVHQRRALTPEELAGWPRSGVSICRCSQHATLPTAVAAGTSTGAFPQYGPVVVPDRLAKALEANSGSTIANLEAINNRSCETCACEISLTPEGKPSLTRQQSSSLFPAVGPTATTDPHQAWILRELQHRDGHSRSTCTEIRLRSAVGTSECVADALGCTDDNKPPRTPVDFAVVALAVTPPRSEAHMKLEWTIAVAELTEGTSTVPPATTESRLEL